MVTSMTAVWPGVIVTGAKLADGSTDSSHRSLVGLVTAGSNVFMVAVSDMFTYPEGAGPEYGPISSGSPNQTPGCTVPPLGVYEPAALSVLVGGPKRSGSA